MHELHACPVDVAHRPIVKQYVPVGDPPVLVDGLSGSKPRSWPCKASLQFDPGREPGPGPVWRSRSVKTGPLGAGQPHFSSSSLRPCTRHLVPRSGAKLPETRGSGVGVQNCVVSRFDHGSSGSFNWNRKEIRVAEIIGQTTRRTTRIDYRVVRAETTTPPQSHFQNSVQVRQSLLPLVDVCTNFVVDNSWSSSAATSRASTTRRPSGVHSNQFHDRGEHAHMRVSREASRCPDLSRLSSIVTSAPCANSMECRCQGHIGREGHSSTLLPYFG